MLPLALLVSLAATPVEVALPAADATLSIEAPAGARLCVNKPGPPRGCEGVKGPPIPDAIAFQALFLFDDVNIPVSGIHAPDVVHTRQQIEDLAKGFASVAGKQIAELKLEESATGRPYRLGEVSGRNAVHFVARGREKLRLSTFIVGDKTALSFSVGAPIAHEAKARAVRDAVLGGLSLPPHTREGFGEGPVADPGADEREISRMFVQGSVVVIVLVLLIIIVVVRRRKR
jgi:hypothetical protein